jgi:CHAD domain-containing protein
MLGMSEFSKWFECDDPARPASDDAAAALAARLDLIPALLADAAAGDGNVEAVHQLRVATRRSRAALDAFRKFLPKRRRGRMKQRLSDIRRAAGAARDLDVLAERYSTNDTSLPADALDWLWATIVAQRRAAQYSLVLLARGYDRGRLQRGAARLLRRVAWRGQHGEPSFGELARQRLGKAAGDFLRAADARPHHVDELHALRIAAKHLRYSIELFGNAFSSSRNKRLTDEVYPTIEEMQDRLGRLNDHATAAERIDAWRTAAAHTATESNRAPMRAAPTSARQIVELEQLQTAAASDEFFAWCNDDRTKMLTEQLAAWT